MKHGIVIKEAQGNFAFRFWIAKAVASEEMGKMMVEGVASTPNVDHDRERMHPEALKAMANIINTSGVPLRVEHSQNDNAIIGNVNKAWVDERNQLWIKAVLDEKHPAAGILYKGLKDGVKMGLSVGGYVKRATQEMVEGIGKMVNTFYDVLLDEVSVTQKPSNYDARLMAKSFAKSEKEIDIAAEAIRQSDFLFHSAMGASDYLQAFAKSIPQEEWKITKDYKLMDKEKSMEDTETKETKKAEDTETKETKKVAEDTETKETKKAKDETDEKTTKSVSRAEFQELVKAVGEMGNAFTQVLGKMAKAMSNEPVDQEQPRQQKKDPEEGKTVDKANDEGAKDQENPSQKKEDPEEGKTVKDREGQTNHEEDGDNLKGERQKKAREGAKDTDTYDLETVERAIKRIKDVAKAMDDTDEKTTKAEDETETRKSVKVSAIDEFVVTVADTIERMEKSMKDGGFQTDHVAKSVINNIRSNPEFRKDIEHFLSEPGKKRSVINGTPFVKMKDGRMFQLTLSETARTEKSVQDVKPGPGAFKNVWGAKFSSQQSE